MKPASDGTHGRIVLRGSIGSKPISEYDKWKVLCANLYKILGILSERLDFLQSLKARRGSE